MTDEKYAGWVAEATEAALAKKNSALPLNRRVKTGRNGENVTRLVRGTVVSIGHLRVELDNGPARA